MLRCPHAVLIALVAAMPLAACSSGGFDPESLTDKLDFINPKKKLPGDRKAVFPGGVPGVTQGVPQELIKGNQPPADSLAAAADPQAAPQPGGPSGQAAAQQPGAEGAQEPPPKPKRVAAKPKPKPQPRPQADPAQEQQMQAQPQPVRASPPQQQLAPWPGSPPPQQSTAQPAWPSSPAPGTFQR